MGSIASIRRGGRDQLCTWHHSKFWSSQVFSASMLCNTAALFRAILHDLALTVHLGTQHTAHSTQHNTRRCTLVCDCCCMWLAVRLGGWNIRNSEQSQLMLRLCAILASVQTCQIMPVPILRTGRRKTKADGEALAAAANLSPAAAAGEADKPKRG